MMSPSSPSKKISTPSSQTYETTRRLRVWLNHSVLAPASPATFHDDGEDLSQQVVTNIDEALETNYKLADFSEEECTEYQEDWIYTQGHPQEYEQELEQTNTLKQQLAQSPLDFLQDNKLLEEEWQWKFGSSGTQEFQFASFEMNGPALDFETEKSKVNHNHRSLDSTKDADTTDGEFADYQQAESITDDDHASRRKTSKAQHDDAEEDFGDFQEGIAAQPSGAPNENLHPAQSEEDETEKEDDDAPTISKEKNAEHEIAGIRKPGLSEEEDTHVIDIPPSHYLLSNNANVGDDFGDFKQASATSRPVHTPKSPDGVSTILNDFQLDFQDFPTPNTLQGNYPAAAAAKDTNPQEPESTDRLALPTTSSPPARNNILTPRNTKATSPDGELPQKVTPPSEPMTPIIHNQSAKKSREIYVDSVSNQQKPLSQPSLDHPDSPVSLHFSDDATDPSVKLFTNTSPVSLVSGKGEDSSIPFVVRVVATKPKSTPTPPPQGTVLFPTLEQEAFFNSPQSMQTAEGRFLRRQYSSKLELEDVLEDDDDDYDAASLSSLQQFYYDDSTENNVDHHILQMLQKLEWDWVPYWQWDSLLFPKVPTNGNEGTGRNARRRLDEDNELEEEEGLEDWMVASQQHPARPSKSSQTKSDLPTEDKIPLFQDELVQQLSHLDSSHVKICKSLHKRIQPHSHHIEQSNGLALELGTNFQLCDMYLQRSIKSVSMAREGNHPGEGVEGAMELVQSWQVHSAYTQLEDLLDKIQNVSEMEKSILDEIESYDACQQDSCRSILNMQLELDTQLQQDPLAKLDCLQPLRARCSSELLKKFQVRLHSCLESVAIRCCNSHDNPLLEQEYRQLVQAIVQVSETIHSTANNKRMASEICTSLQTAWLLQTQRSFGLALLDPTDDPGDSEYDKELMALSSLYDINVGSGLWFMDPSKLAVWKYNLVTIRLDFEIQLHPLPAVLHKLCVILFQVLNGHYTLWHWHTLSDHSIHQALKQELSRRRPSIWNACIQVLEDCFEEYLKYAGKKKLFDSDSNDDDWLLDLEGLEDVVGMVGQFLSLQSEFLKDIDVARSVNDGSLVEKKLHSVLQKHVRAFHIQAMNSMGSSLYREDWALTPVGEGDAGDLMDILNSLLQDERIHRNTACCRSRCNLFVANKDSHFANFQKQGNPFHIEVNTLPERAFKPCEYDTTHSDDSAVKEVFRLLSLYCDKPGSVNSVPKCFSQHAVKWIARILMMMKMLPSVTEDAMTVLENVFNLYITTAFRVCAGSSAHEQILLGITSPQIPDYLLDPASPRASSPKLFGFGRRSSSTPSTPRATPAVTPIIDGELCAPLSCEMDALRTVQNLIVNAQKELAGFVKLDLVEGWITDPVREPGEERLAIVCRRARVLEARHAVAWSCVFMAATLHIARLEIHQVSKDATSLEALDEYVESFLHAVPLLLSMSNRISCIRAISGKAIVQEIINLGSVWEEARLHEHANQYIESICDICSLLWCSLSNARNLPSGALNIIWENMVGGCYLALLDGFSRLPFCSTEGRALMSMDLASLTIGIQPDSVLEHLEDQAETKPPPKVSIARGMSYVDTYIKVFYFPPLDAYNWIEENYTQYQGTHTVALISGATFASGDRHVAAAKKVIRKVKALYEVEAKVTSV